MKYTLLGFTFCLLSGFCSLCRGEAPVSPPQDDSSRQPSPTVTSDAQENTTPPELGQMTEPQQPAAGPPVPLGFCKNDARPEIRYFCPFLSAVLEGVAHHQTPAQMRRYLNRLNPSDPESISMLISAVSVQLATKGAVAGFLQQTGQSRPDQQLGASNTASGTTSLVTKAGSAELLAFAIDTGALTQSVNGSTATVNSNADQIYRLVTGHDSGCIINCGSDGGKVGAFETHVLNPLNFAASFSLAQTSTTTTPTTGQASGTTPSGVTMASIPTGAGKLTNITAKYQLLNKYDPRGASFQNAWKTQVVTLAQSSSTLVDDTIAARIILESDKAFSSAAASDAYQQQLLAAATDPSGAKLVASFEKLWANATNTALQSPALPDAVAKVIKDRALYRTAWSQAIANAAGVMLTVQYSFNKPLNQPQTHDVTCVYGYSFGNSETLTVNGAVSIYNGALPAAAAYGRIHYGQVSGEYDRNLSAPTSSVQEQLSLAGYWQYQPSPSVLNIPAGTVAPGTNIPLPNGTQEFVGTAGSLWVTQAKLTIKGMGGVNIPIGVSWSNKTDLLQGSKVGAQVGLSYNFSSLGALF